jgi:hypothetical protein
MSTYEQLRGARLKFLDQDPANASNGQVWYNSTTGKDRVQGIGTAVFSSGGNLATAKGQSGNFGIQTAAVAAAGATPTRVTDVQEYNGVGWSNGTAYPTALNELAGAGTETAGLVIGGRSNPPDAVTTTSEYDGFSWTAGGVLPAKRNSTMSSGTQTAGLYAFGRDQTTPTYFTTSFEYDGSSWTAGNSGSTARAYLGGFGVQTSAVACGGYFSTSPYKRAAVCDPDCA